MTAENNPQIELRLMALEFVLQNLLVTMHSNAKDPVSSIEGHRERFRKFFERNSAKFSTDPDLLGISPTLMSGAVDRLLSMAEEEIMLHMYKDRPPS